MSMVLVHLGCTVLVTTPKAVVLSVCKEVLGCGWPISSSSKCMGTASLAFMYRAPSSASAAEDITALIIDDVLCMAPLLGGMCLSSDK